jgi:hypothetical protein
MEVFPSRRASRTYADQGLAASRSHAQPLRFAVAIRSSQQSEG